MIKKIRGLRLLVLGSAATLIAAVGGCECEDDLVEIPGPTCKLDTQCASNEAYRFGKCISSYCEEDAECCPGTYCATASHACLPNTLQVEYECRSNLDCFERTQDPALGCVILEEAEVGTCRYQACRDRSGCGDEQSCFKGWCVAQAPCGGACPAGQVCEVGTNRCHPVEGHPGCDKACDPGSLLVVSDPEVMVGDLCCPISCGCAVLPELLPGVFGRFSSTAIGANEIVVSAYEETHGDLVVAHFTPQGELRGVEFIDGIPEGGEVRGDPQGPRHGIVTPGPDMGQYSSLVVNAAGEPRVAYYDADNGDLRIAVYSRTGGGWSTHVVDDERDAGRYASLVLDPNTERLRVAYRIADLEGTPRPRSAVRVASSATPTPQSANDWQVATVEEVETPHPCGDPCQAGFACVWDASQAICRPEATGCDSPCADGQACVEADGEARCRAALPPELAGLPAGTGLFISMAYTPGDDAVVYYDSVGRDLRGARIGSAGPTTPVVVDGDGLDGRNAGDLGRFASVAYDERLGELAVAYSDLTTRRLRYYHGTDLRGGTFEVIDDGYGAPPGISMVGMDAALGFAADGTACVVYQDASYMDLAFASRSTVDGAWDSERLLADGAYGFDPSIAVTGNLVYAASAAPRLDVRRRLASRLHLFLRPR